MDEEGSSDVSERIITFLKDNILVVVLFSIGIILLVSGLVLFSGKKEPEIQLEEAETVVVKQNIELTVDIEGAVIRPGLYKLPTDSRIKDALVSAGGLSPEADRVYVEKKINLAQKVIDGVKIYIPRASDNQNISLVESTDNISININTASLPELDTLPGIGSVTAQKIVDSRPYQSIQELLDKKVVNSSVYEKIKDKVTVY